MFVLAQYTCGQLLLLPTQALQNLDIHVWATACNSTGSFHYHHQIAFFSLLASVSWWAIGVQRGQRNTGGFGFAVNQSSGGRRATKTQYQVATCSSSMRDTKLCSSGLCAKTDGEGDGESSSLGKRKRNGPAGGRDLCLARIGQLHRVWRVRLMPMDDAP